MRVCRPSGMGSSLAGLAGALLAAGVALAAALASGLPLAFGAGLGAAFATGLPLAAAFAFGAGFALAAAFFFAMKVSLGACTGNPIRNGYVKCAVAKGRYRWARQVSRIP